VNICDNTLRDIAVSLRIVMRDEFVCFDIQNETSRHRCGVSCVASRTHTHTDTLLSSTPTTHTHIMRHVSSYDSLTLCCCSINIALQLHSQQTTDIHKQRAAITALNSSHKLLSRTSDMSVGGTALFCDGKLENFTL